MSSEERNLIGKILQTRDLSEVNDAGINAKFFQEPEHRTSFKFITDHQKKYSQVPSADAFKLSFPTYRMPSATDAMPYYIDLVVERYKKHLLETGLSEAVDLFEANDLDAAKLALASTLNVINNEVTRSKVVDLTKTGVERMERYREMSKAGGAMKGISSGFQSIDASTGGFQKKQLITFAGPPKAGKSTILLLAMMAAHRAFYRPLFIGFEMTNEEQEERHDAIRASLSHTKLRDGTLSQEEFRALDKMTRRLESMPPLIFSEDANSSLTLSGVASQIEKYNPDIVYVDGVYMMDDENGEAKGSSFALTNITRGFKRMAKAFDLPIGISTQVLEWKMDRKRGVTSGSLGYSSSFIQDSDQVISVERTDDPSINKMKVLLGRNNAGMEVFVRWNWATGEFTEVQDLEQEAEDAVSKF